MKAATPWTAGSLIAGENGKLRFIKEKTKVPKESSLRSQLRDLIVQEFRGFVTNHEDKFSRGIPDTSFAIDHTRHKLSGFYQSRCVSGWIELKHEHSWPKMWKTELRIGLRPEQRIWIRSRWEIIHDVFILVRIEDDIYMFTGQYVDELYAPISRERFEKLWVGKWQVRIDKKEFLEIVCETIR